MKPVPENSAAQQAGGLNITPMFHLSSEGGNNLLHGQNNIPRRLAENISDEELDHFQRQAKASSDTNSAVEDYGRLRQEEADKFLRKRSWSGDDAVCTSLVLSLLDQLYRQSCSGKNKMRIVNGLCDVCENLGAKFEIGGERTILAVTRQRGAEMVAKVLSKSLLKDSQGVIAESGSQFHKQSSNRPPRAPKKITILA
jgi:hypothetical protein